MKKIRAPMWKILVRLKDVEIEREERSKGGIVLAINSSRDIELEKQGMTLGYIIEIGPWAGYNDKMPSKEVFKIGDCVKIHKHSGVLMAPEEVGDDDHTYRMIQDLDIQAILEDESIEL